MVASALIAVQGRIQREGEVVHLVAHRLVDLSAELATRRQPATRLSRCRMDAAIKVTHASGGPILREHLPKGLGTRDIYVPD